VSDLHYHIAASDKRNIGGPLAESHSPGINAGGGDVVRSLPALRNVSGIILAGGRSRRMGGHNKALFRVGGTRIIERVVGVMARVFARVLVVTNTPDEFAFLGLPMVPDIRPGAGSLGGLYTGLHHCPTEYGFLVACDMPFLQEGIIRYLTGLIDGHDVVVPRVGAHLEPLHAVYSRRCIPYIEALLHEDELAIIAFYPHVSLREVDEAELRLLDPTLTFLMNLNTPDDLRKAEELAQEQDRGPSDNCLK
jgi:molybdopterin-guanine dinucleotide biosynthesis protein A